MLYFAPKTETVLLQNAKVNGRLENIYIENGKIAQRNAEKELAADQVIDLEGKRLRPGLIDVHCHGCMNMETTDGEEAQVAMSHYWAKEGITSWYPTGTTLAISTLKECMKRIPETPYGANILGYHSEGPYINDSRRGAQNPAFIKAADPCDFAELDTIKLITLAPETPGAMEYIKKSPILCVLGHTDADYETALAAFQNGAKCVTHLFNAMPPLHHREPSVLGAAFDGNAFVQVISDGIHLHPSVVRMTYRLFGPERMILISDAVRPALVPDGKYESGGLTVWVKNGTARLEDGTIAGSTTSLFQCVKRAIAFGVPTEDAFRMASETPARMMGLKKGLLHVGYDAEFIALDDNDNLCDTLILNK